MKTLAMPPYAPTLIESTRAIGYTIESAIADIVDNSISASASCTDIFFFPIGEAYIAVLDDGYGMTSDELNTAMRYGSQNPKEERAANDLGRFGLGLKTASLSQCRTLTVACKQGLHIEVRRWDIDYVTDTGEWSLIVLDTEEEINSIPRIDRLREYGSGTLVVWQNLDRLRVGEIDFSRSMSKKMNSVRAHLSLVFHRYLSGETGLKRILLRMNEHLVEPADPFLTKRNTQIMADEVMEIEGSKVVIRPHILPHVLSLTSDEINELGGKDGLRKRQGFYVYRNKRLLIWGTWFHMMRQGELSKLARVQVDIPNELDYLWTLDIKKSTAIPPEMVRNNLDSVIERLAEQSKRTWVYRGKRETQDSVVHIWNRFKGRHGGIYYNINRDHPLVEVFNDAAQSVMHNIEMLLTAIESSIPLNQLYLDLTSEKQFDNETIITAPEVEDMLRALLEQMPSDTAKGELLARLAVSDPFVNYPTIIERYRAGGIANGRE
ncbi:MAG: ATP-binding protein [Desulfovibrio sp.]|jgi:hypothetical protein|nr:ATP-binding protein [Desulfovibrio sp.]